ncbi:MAG: hypothetical protein L0387_02520 [Acidobacteria bacterium]|nr:hypothetical protein [Acidobacteriota bacterium]MCI0724841.1 hypothetical protein [Acidobacteriota bacterium]
MLRGAYGLFYNPIGINYWSGVPYGFAPGFRGDNSVRSTGNAPRFNWDSGYPDNYKPPTLDPNNLIWGMVAIDERSLFAGYTHQYNVSVQYSLSKDMVLETALLGNQGRRLNGAQCLQPSLFWRSGDFDWQLEYLRFRQLHDGRPARDSTGCASGVVSQGCEVMVAASVPRAVASG